mmetsp:Transcript_112167/g.324035  ORF Transcript_112167/g.324035 Transcript_112167/m.324035 type:complete len:203 (-) Transcript_112167:64-672(-)
MRIPNLDGLQRPLVHNFLYLSPRHLWQAAPIYEDGNAVHPKLVMPRKVPQQRREVPEVKALRVRVLAAQPTVGYRQNLRRCHPVILGARNQLLYRPNCLRRQVLPSRQSLASTVHLLEPIAAHEDHIPGGEGLAQGVPILVVGLPAGAAADAGILGRREVAATVSDMEVDSSTCVHAQAAATTIEHGHLFSEGRKLAAHRRR